jgi:hypothetical protein
MFWQTQGSGKSYSMGFYSQKIQRKVPGDWTFVIVTDRTDLDEQIAETFKAAGVVSQARCNLLWPPMQLILRKHMAERGDTSQAENDPGLADFVLLITILVAS